MGVIDKVKTAAGQATTAAQENVATVQTKRKLAQAHRELGQTTYELVEGGELTHPRLSSKVEQIRTFKAQLDHAETTLPTAPASGTSPEPPPVPPL